MPTDAHPLLVEHAAGDSYREIGERHGISHEAARQTVIRESTAFLNQVELALWVAWNTNERLGREAEAEWPTFVVLYQVQPGQAASPFFFTWVVGQLKARDLDVHVRTRPCAEGVAFMLTIDTLGASA